MMEIGIQGSGQLTDGVPDPGRYRAVAELAEELGYDSIWAGEHLSFHNPILDLGVALAVFAAVTERIRLGAGVVLLPLRHPSLVAKQAASLDYVSGGRLMLGVGVGGEGAQDFEATGVPLEERGSRADEGIAALRRLFADRPASFSGRHYRFRDVSIEPAPIQPGGPPILVGGRSEAAQRRAGTLGDGWLPYLVSPRSFAVGVEKVQAHAAAAGRDPAELRHGIVAYARVEDDGAQAREAAREHLSQRYGMRFEPHHVERLCVAGSPEECTARVREYADAGASHLALNPAVDGVEFVSQVERLRAVAVAASEVRT
ncbi:MAG TPA: LLM class flavin-dependent oxidoreductase [Gaiellaceae bacterium]|nr:LLM class flavin-dependent oxidoreductase [Gaiellaceae bacterium]